MLHNIDTRNFHVIKELRCTIYNHQVRQIENLISAKKISFAFPIRQLPCNFCDNCTFRKGHDCTLDFSEVIICIKKYTNYRVAIFFICVLENYKTISLLHFYDNLSRKIHKTQIKSYSFYNILYNCWIPNKHSKSKFFTSLEYYNGHKDC